VAKKKLQNNDDEGLAFFQLNTNLTQLMRGDSTRAKSAKCSRQIFCMAAPNAIHGSPLVADGFCFILHASSSFGCIRQRVQMPCWLAIGY
jgi:hypothetical protein